MRANTLRSERGSAMLEMALTLPILLLISVGIFEFGRAFQTWQVMTNAAREGARVAVMPGAVTADVKTRVKNYMKSGQLEYWETCTVSVDPDATISIGAVNAKASIVTVSYPFKWMVLGPVAKLVAPSSSFGTGMTLQTKAEMRNESQF